MTDIITKRLRSDGLLGDCSEAIELCREAADEIDRLRDERDFQEMGWRNQTAMTERLRALIEEVLDKEMSAHEWKIWAATANGILSEMRHEKTISDEDLNAVLEVEPGTGGE